MNTSILKTFVQQARTTLQELISNKIKCVLSPHHSYQRDNPRIIFDLQSDMQRYGKELIIEDVACL